MSATFIAIEWSGEAAVVENQAMEGRSGVCGLETSPSIDPPRRAAIRDDRTIPPRYCR
jgi:hypothetical protein